MNIIINGGTRGIGKEVLIQLAQDTSNQILVTGRNEKALEKLAAGYINVRALAIDMSHFDNQVERFKKAVTDYFGSIDIVINIAGYLVNKEFLKISNDEARLMMETNFFGPATLIRTIRPMMSKVSHIVNIASMGGFQGSVKYKGLAYYSASKAALACLTECLAIEFTGSGININCLALGSVQTEMLDEAFPGYNAPLDAKQIAGFISNFALTGHKFFNGKILPVALQNP